MRCADFRARRGSGVGAAGELLRHDGRADVYTGGVKLIAVTTPKGVFHVWTKRVGNNPKIKVLLLHGGPGATHEYFEAADSYLPAAGVEYYYYDQLGSFYSDQPKDSSLWNTARFVEEVEQVRKALGMDSTNFYLLGHSWGGLLATEYALKYQKNLKGLIISNMMASIPAYQKYADSVLMPAMDQKVLGEVKALEAKKQYANPRYMQLLIPAHYEKHILRRPYAEWPDPVTRAFKHINEDIYIPMQGPSQRSERQAREVGSKRGPQEHRGAHARHRRHVRHDGSEIHGMDVEAVSQGSVSSLSELGTHGDVRRRPDVFRRLDLLPQECRCRRHSKMRILE